MACANSTCIIPFENRTTDFDGILPGGEETEEGDYDGGGGGDGGFLGDAVASKFELATKVVALTGVSVLGLLANVVNVVVFARQGFKDTINISLTGLSVADFGSLLGLLCMSVCYNPLVIRSGIPVDLKKIQYLIAGWPHVCFARISCYITAFITFERCLCIALPHKVKVIITPRRTFVIVASIFVLITAGITPMYFATRFTFVTDDRTNRSLLSFEFVEDGRAMENGTLLYSIFLLLSACTIVGTCTATLIHCLHRKSQWRKSMTSVQVFAARDRRIVKMVLSVAIIFIVCYLPSSVAFILMVCFPDFSIVGAQKNLFIVVFGFMFILEAVNASVNIFIYYHMSSKFKAELQRLLLLPLICQKRHLPASTGEEEQTTTASNEITSCRPLHSQSLSLQEGRSSMPEPDKEA